jgi:hypothetical protein
MNGWFYYGSQRMTDLYAVLTRRDGAIVSLSILTSGGAEIDSRRPRELLDPETELVWADRVLNELQLDRLADWRAISVFADETIHEVTLQLRTSPNDGRLEGGPA